MEYRNDITVTWLTQRTPGLTHHPKLCSQTPAHPPHGLKPLSNMTALLLLLPLSTCLPPEF